MRARLHSLQVAGLLGLLAAACAASALDLTLDSGERQGHLVELFTSEGCSSCPPADRWLSTLRKDARLWKTIVPVAFHVDYWDYIGWPDRFAHPQHSARQRHHRGVGNVYSVYTPGFVVDGREWRGWFDGDALPVHDARPRARLSVRLTDTSGPDKQLRATVEGASELPSGLVLNMAILGMELSTEVSAGENTGKRLAHDFVLLRWHRWPLVAEGDSRASLQMPFRLPRTDAKRLAVSIWAAPADSERPLQAVGGYLD